MKKQKYLALTALVAVATLVGCSTNASDGGNGDDFLVGYSQPIGSQTDQQMTADGLTTAADELGWSTRLIDANLSVDKQMSDLQTLTQLGAEAIGIWALDSDALRSAYANANSQDVSLVGVNSEADEFAGTVWWQTYVCEDGAPAQETAKYIAAHKGADARVIVIGGPPVPAIRGYAECFTEAAESEGLQVVNQTDNTTDSSSAASTIVSELLLQYPDVDAIWTFNDLTALGASSAVQQADQMVYDESNDGIAIFGLNANDDALEAVRQGRLTGTWDTDPVATGWAVIKMVNDIKEGAVESGEATAVVESTLWTSENIADYVAPEERSYTIDTVPLVD